MKFFFQSLRWRLQAWHSLILLAVLAAFGITVYYLNQETRWRRVDRELQRRVNILIASLPPGPPVDRIQGGKFRFGIGGGGGGSRRGSDMRETPEMRQPSGSFDLRIPLGQEYLFDNRFDENFYYLVWSVNGTVLRQSTNAPATIAKPKQFELLASPVVRVRDNYREIIQPARRGLILLVGCNIMHELIEFRRFGWICAAVGGMVLAIGLAGGWWLATRAIQPIGEISKTARLIAEGDLSKRVNISKTDNELGQLAEVLNNTFDRLQTVFARQTQFTADASHELRTPISIILSQTQFALKSERSSNDYRESLEACQRSALRMRQLIEALLTLARLDAAEPLKHQTFDLGLLIRETVDALRPMAAEREIQVICSASNIQMKGSSEQLRQLVSNLVNNAISYNHPKGEVNVNLSEDAHSLILTVKDTGQGIDAADLPHIFERFYRADKSRSRAEGHSGLGLAIVKTIVEAHRGTIDVVSDLGKGSVFTIRFPK